MSPLLSQIRGTHESFIRMHWKLKKIYGTPNQLAIFGPRLATFYRPPSSSPEMLDQSSAFFNNVLESSNKKKQIKHR